MRNIGELARVTLLVCAMVGVAGFIGAQEFTKGVGFGVEYFTLGGAFDGSTEIDVSDVGGGSANQDALAIILPDVSSFLMYGVWFTFAPFPAFQTTSAFRFGSGANDYESLDFSETKGTAILELLQEIAILPLIRPRYKVGGYGRAGISYMYAEASQRVVWTAFPLTGDIAYVDTEFLGYRLGVGALGEFSIVPNGRFVLVGRAGWSFAPYISATVGGPGGTQTTVSAGSNSFEGGLGIEYRFR